MRINLSLIITLFFVSIHAQNYKYGKISKEELTKEKSTIDPESAAEVLYETANYKIEYLDNEGRFYLTKEVEGRIKIYDKDQVSDQYLVQRISLHTPSSTRDKLLTFKGSTANLEGGKVVNQKVRNSDIFVEKANKYWEIHKMTFPDVKDGSVIEYQYSIISPFMREIDRWYFQQSIPVVYSSFKLVRPEFFVYSPDERGEVRGKTSTRALTAHNASYKNTITEHIFENLKPLKNEAYVLNSNNLKASVRYEMMKFEYPGMITENYSTSWQQIGKDLMQHENFGRQLSGNNFLDETVQGITANISSPQDKMNAVFNHVKDNYAWNKFRSKYTDNGIRNTFKNKTGNAADINLMLVSMLQKAGLNAYPVVLSTVGNLMINYTFPSITSLDFVIAAVDLNGHLYLMDATEKLSKINMLPLRDLNHRGFVLTDKDVIEIQLTNQSVSSMQKTVKVQINPTDGTLTGNFTDVQDNYFAMLDKMEQLDDPKGFESDYLDQYSFDIDGFKIDELPEKSIIRYSFKFSDIPGAEIVGNKIILNPMFFLQLKRNSFTQDNRNYPLEFGTTFTNSKMVQIKIPDGYKVETMPTDKQGVASDRVAGFSYQVIEKDGFLIVSSIYEVGHSILPATYYRSMKDLENQRIDAESQSIVLIKQ